MTRRERNARRRLAYHLDKARLAVACKPMVWGEDDCALFNANVQLAAMGIDPAAAFRGRYRTQRGAHRVLGLMGLPMMLQRFTRKHNRSRVDPNKARIGDIGLVPVGGAYACVRLLHRNEWIGRSEIGWFMLPTEHVRMAWRAA